MDSHSTQSLYSPKWLNALLVFALLVVPVASIQVIRTIDDQDGDSSNNAKVHYDTASWKYGPGCQECILKVNPVASAFHSSWHDVQAAAGGHESFTITFPGTAIYVYGIIPNAAQMKGQHSMISLTFSLDGSPSGPPFLRQLVDGGDPFTFDVPVYANYGLSNTTHTLTVSLATGSDPNVVTNFLFDYANYTFEALPVDAVSTPSATNSTIQESSIYSHPTPTVSIAIGAVGWFLFIVVSSVFAWFWRQQRRRTRIYASSLTDKKRIPFIHDPELELDSTEPRNSASQPPSNRSAPNIASHPVNAAPTNGSLTAENLFLRDQIGQVRTESESSGSQNTLSLLIDTSEVDNPPPEYHEPGRRATVTAGKR